MIVHKYPIEVGIQEIEMHTPVCMLHAAEQYRRLQLWAVVRPSSTQRRKILVAGTGYALPEEVDASGYISTVQSESGLVWHVFDLGAVE